METTKALIIPPGGDAAWIDLPKDGQRRYQAERAIIGGILTSLAFGEFPLPDGSECDVYGMVHDEGLLIGLPPNVRTDTGQLLVGNIIIGAMRWNKEADDSVYCDVPQEAFVWIDRWLKERCTRPGKFDYEIGMPIILGGDEALAVMKGEAPPPIIRGAGIKGVEVDAGRCLR